MAGVSCVRVTLWVIGEFVTLYMGGGVKVTGDTAISGGGDVRSGHHPPHVPLLYAGRSPSPRCGGACVVRDVRHDGGRCMREARRGRACERGAGEWANCVRVCVGGRGVGRAGARGV